MFRRFSYLLLLTLLLTAAGCGRQSPTVPDASVPETPISVAQVTEPETPEPYEDGPWTVFSCGGTEIPVPTEYLELLTIATDFAPLTAPDAGQTLISFTETASLEAYRQSADYAGEDDGMGALFGIAVYTPESAKLNAQYDLGGWEVFGRDGDGNCYAVVRPTDVRLFRLSEAPGSADLETWSALNAMSADMIPEILTRNGLTACTAAELLGTPA